MAKAVPKLPIQSPDRIGARLPNLRRLCVAGPTIAHKHYLTVTDDPFDAAAKTGDWAVDANARIVSQRLARKNPHGSFRAGKRVFLGRCGTS
jgi:hypothetical protein